MGLAVFSEYEYLLDQVVHVVAALFAVSAVIIYGVLVWIPFEMLFGPCCMSLRGPILETGLVQILMINLGIDVKNFKD